MSLPSNQADTVRLRLFKAKLFGIHTGMYETGVAIGQIARRSVAARPAGRWADRADHHGARGVRWHVRGAAGAR